MLLLTCNFTSTASGGSLYDYLAALQKCPEELARTWALQVSSCSFCRGVSQAGIFYSFIWSLKRLSLSFAQWPSPWEFNALEEDITVSSLPR